MNTKVLFFLIIISWLYGAQSETEVDSSHSPSSGPYSPRTSPPSPLDWFENTYHAQDKSLEISSSFDVNQWKDAISKSNPDIKWVQFIDLPIDIDPLSKTPYEDTIQAMLPILNMCAYTRVSTITLKKLFIHKIKKIKGLLSTTMFLFTEVESIETFYIAFDDRLETYTKDNISKILAPQNSNHHCELKIPQQLMRAEPPSPSPIAKDDKNDTPLSFSPFPSSQKLPKKEKNCCCVQ